MKAFDNDIKVFLQDLEQERTTDLSKMNSHWEECKKMMQAPTPAGRLDHYSKYRDWLLWSIAGCLLIIGSVFFFIRRDYLNNKPSNERIEKLNTPVSKTPITDTAIIGKAADTTSPPAKKIRRQNTPIRSSKVVTPPAVDTVEKNKAKKGSMRRRSGSTNEKTTAIVDSTK